MPTPASALSTRAAGPRDAARPPRPDGAIWQAGARDLDSEPSSPRPLLSIVAALLGLLILVFGFIVGAHLVAPRIYSDEDLRR